MGSSVSVFGVLVFFAVILNMYYLNNLFFQLPNNRYVIGLNQSIDFLYNAFNDALYADVAIRVDLDIDRWVHLFVFRKYNFFRTRFDYSSYDLILYQIFQDTFLYDTKFNDVANLVWFEFFSLMSKQWTLFFSWVFTRHLLNFV